MNRLVIDPLNHRQQKCHYDNHLELCKFYIFGYEDASD